jgi:hypothetical protein
MISGDFCQLTGAMFNLQDSRQGGSRPAILTDNIRDATGTHNLRASAVALVGHALRR